VAPASCSLLLVQVVADNDLAGIGVLVTRPRHQSKELVATITAHGGEAIEWPVLEIIPRDADAIRADERRLGSPDIAVFVSPNAVRHGLAFTADARIAVVGPATARAIEDSGRSVDIRSPDGYDSEHLLAEAELQDVDGKNIRIIRGDGGRELLADTLRQRGATVEYLTVYARGVPAYSESELASLEQQWRSGAIKVVAVMSVESLRNLVSLLPDWCRGALANTLLVTPAARVIQEAVKQFPGIPATLAAGTSAGDMVDAIVSSSKTTRGKH
jgi:uroporphyrinogen-III synthase